MSSPLPPPWRPRRRLLVLSRPARDSWLSCNLARGASARYGPHPQPVPRLVAAESPPSTSLAAVGAIRGDAETGIALSLVLAAAMSFFPSLTILSFSACQAVQKMETAANKLANVFAEDVPGTLFTKALLHGDQ